MKEYVMIAGVNGTGKTSLLGVLVGQGFDLGHIVDQSVVNGKQAVREIDRCLQAGETVTQETTLSGHRTKRTAAYAKAHGYTVTMYYIGLNSRYESIYRIANRVRKGGHDIDPEAVKRRYEKRFDDLAAVMPYCDRIVFYDNENGFVKVAELIGGAFRFTNGYRPDWIIEFSQRYFS